jgi:hypothetical protein
VAVVCRCWPLVATQGTPTHSLAVGPNSRHREDRKQNSCYEMAGSHPGVLVHVQLAKGAQTAMHPPLNLSDTLATTTSAATYLGWVFLSGVVGLVAVIRVLRQPADRWRHRSWSKVAWVLAILYIAPPLAGYPIPVGAIAAIWRTGGSNNSSTQPGLPRAEGSPNWPLPWDTK